jgi:hypothetical protein
MSIAWTRIVPTGAAGSPINAKGVEFYRTLITELLKNGIVPAITMFHWWEHGALHGGPGRGCQGALTQRWHARGGLCVGSRAAEAGGDYAVDEEPVGL